MAKVSKVDSCMFCGNAPCTCNAKPKAAMKVPRKRAAPIVSESNTGSNPSSSKPPSQKADAHSAMRAAAKVHHTGATVKADNEAIDEIVAIKADPELSAAVRAVEPLMHATEMRRFAEILKEPPAPAERALVWKRRVTGE
jgi:hypothetical protein